ncbi:MAG TPA: hypothetical protein P5191_11655 [Ruminococcus sp.]|nr:hypothetical protein [Ruminococcus sp.]
MKQIEILITITALMALFASCGKLPKDSSTVMPSEITVTTVTEPVQTSEQIHTTTTTAAVISTTLTSASTSNSSISSAEIQTTKVTAAPPAPEETAPPQTFAAAQETPRTTTVQIQQNTGFEAFSDYVSWAGSTGYPSGLLEANGVSGINQDYFHTPPGTAGYDSGRIVVGDSRCCQLGIYQQRTGLNDFAAFAVWGGHYISGYGGIMTEEHFREVEQCFQSQIENCGKSTIYFFATVNDYDCWNNDNSSYISSAIGTAERLASMSYEVNDTIYHPEVFVIGFDGCWLTGDLFGTPQDVFNRYIQDYNDKLASACSSSSSLKNRFTTVMDIVGGKAGFIDDGLHYSDDTLEKIISYISD